MPWRYPTHLRTEVGPEANGQTAPKGVIHDINHTLFMASIPHATRSTLVSSHPSTHCPLFPLRGCVLLIIDAEVPIVADPSSGDGGGEPSGCGGCSGGGGGGGGNGGGGGKPPGGGGGGDNSNDSGGSDDGKGSAAGSRGPSTFGHLDASSPSGNDSKTELLREALEALLFPGAVPVPPRNPGGSTNVPPPPAILSISPAAVYVPSHVPEKCSSSSSDDCGGSSVVSVTLSLHLSRPLLPEEGVTLLARHRQCFLDVRVEPASVCKEQREDNGLTIKVRQLPTRLNSPPAPNFLLSAAMRTTCRNVY